MKRFIGFLGLSAIPLLVFLIVGYSSPKKTNALLYKDKNQPIETRVQDLLGRMTLEEKVAQIQCIWSQKAGVLDDKGNFSAKKAKARYPYGIGQVARPSEGTEGGGGTGRLPRENAELANAMQKYFVEDTRLGIPVIFHEELLHGHAARMGTSFPQPIGVASSWNRELVQQLYAMAALEASSRGTHLALTPVVDVARDPRWGRVEETFGEDPYLVGQMGLAAVKGLQGESRPVQKGHVLATLKHFAAHGQPEGGMNIGPPPVDERTLHEVFLYPFKVAVQEGNVGAIMASYNEINGVPAHGNKWLLNDLLREQWGFKGVVVSDYYGVEELHKRHHVAADSLEAGALALKSGVDIELPDPNSFPAILELVKSGKLEERYVDSAVVRMLRQKFELGLFENPYADPAAAEKIVGSEQHGQLALKAAEESIILLKNTGVLPIKKGRVRTIAVIGPNADRVLLGGYSDRPPYHVTVKQGIEKALGQDYRILYAEGLRVTEEGSWYQDPVKLADPKAERQLMAEAVRVARRADLIILAVGGNELTSREAWSETHMGDMASLEMVGLQDELVNQLSALGKPIVSLLFNGRPLAVSNLAEKSDALLECWYLGQESGTAVANVLTGAVNPSGKLTISIPRSAGHIPAFYNHKPTARRGYLFDSPAVLFPFGYGLSYTEFTLGAPTLSSNQLAADGSVQLTVQLRNRGDYAGQEVVQLYIRDRVSSVTRPVMELKGFQKVMLEPGETKQLSFTITPAMLAFFNLDMQYMAEAGDFDLMVGTSSRKEDLQTISLTLTQHVRID